jgi:hypothetical protein
MCSENKKRREEKKERTIICITQDTKKELKRSRIIIAKIYMQHKEPVIGDFCCRVNFLFVF